MLPDDKLTLAVKSLALKAGFHAVGIAPAGVAPHGEALGRWLANSWHGDMAYMAANLDKRRDPRRLVEGARSVICLAAGYGTDQDTGCKPVPPDQLIAAFARGRDYHKVLKKRCHALMDRLRELDGGFEGRAFVDSGPIMERSLAAWAGLGWIGRNGCLFVEGLGSYVLLCEIVCNLPLCPDASGAMLPRRLRKHVLDAPAGCHASAPFAEACPGHCDGCGACAKACPTGALGEGGLVDARKCISYLTIEHRGEIDPALWPRMGCHVFGCDACQEACPQNQRLAAGGGKEVAGSGFRAASGDSELIEPSGALSGATLAGILAWTLEDWDRATRGSTCRRATHEMFLRNAVIAAGNSNDPSLVRPLEAAADRWPGLEGAVRWAVERIRGDVPPDASL